MEGRYYKESEVDEKIDGKLDILGYHWALFSQKLYELIICYRIS